MPTFAEPWTAIDAEEAAGLERQLRVEVGNGHALRDVSVKAIARRVDQDDVLFQLADERVAEVHLTWRASAEPNPLWPSVAFFKDLSDWHAKSK